MLLAGVKVLLCTVSMILTALFALSFSGLQVIQSDAGLSGAQATASVNGFELLSAGLMIAVGIAIDSSKYLFWSRAHHPGFIALSLGLVIFSWLASLAFFLASDALLHQQQERMSPQYQAYQNRIAALQQTIAYRQRLIDKQLNSQYHAQWQQGQQQLIDLAQRREQLHQLLANQARVLASAEVPERPSQQLFASVAVWLGEEADTVRFTFFALLSLLIEFSALGLIRLSSEHHGLAQQPAAPPDDLRSTPNANDHSETAGDELKHKKACLLRDIVLGKQAPVVRQIKKANYGLSLDVIKSLLEMLKTQGVLEPDQRNSYKLAQTDQSTAIMESADTNA